MTATKWQQYSDEDKQRIGDLIHDLCSEFRDSNEPHTDAWETRAISLAAIVNDRIWRNEIEHPVSTGSGTRLAVEHIVFGDGPA